MSLLSVIIPEKQAFYSLYADGLIRAKFFDREKKATVISFAHNAVAVLYYTYPTHREACVIRNAQDGKTPLPGLSKPVSLLFSLAASRVDKLRRAVAFLEKNHGTRGGAFNRDNGFYIRLFFLLREKGKLRYTALAKLAEYSARKSFSPTEEVS
jgi:hypothetical protein